MRIIFPLLFLIVSHSNTIVAQIKLECSIHFNDTVMVEQPMYFEYYLSNPNRKTISVYYDALGQNFNNLSRDESFSIKIYDSGNKLIPTIKSIQDDIIGYSRRVGYQKLENGDSLVYKIWIDNWVELNKPGIYTIECSKEFRWTNGHRKVQKVTTSSYNNFEVIPFDSSKKITRGN